MTGLLLKLILLLLVIRALWRLIGGVMKGLGAGSGGGSSNRAGVALSRDPVCGTYVVPGRALAARHGNLVRYFCSERCREQFARAPREIR